MINITGITERNIFELKNIISTIETDLATFPDCVLEINKSPTGKYSFKAVSREGGSYKKKILHITDTLEIELLAKKSYYKKLLPILRQELATLEKFHSDYDFMKKYEVYRKLHPEKQKFVRPVFPTVQTRIEDWKKQPYKPLIYKENDWRSEGGRPSREFIYTESGLAVKSKSEYMIATELDKRKDEMLYRYEQALALADGGKVYPDFEIISMKTGKVYYFEHFGMMDDPEYLEAFVKKMQRYRSSGILLGQNLIATYEASKKPLSPSQIKAALEIID